MALVLNAYHLNVDPLFEIPLAPDFCRLALPFGAELLHKYDVVRIPHRNRDTAHFAGRQPDGEFLPYFRLAHISFEFITGLTPADERATLSPGAGADGERLLGLLGVCSAHR